MYGISLIHIFKTKIDKLLKLIIMNFKILNYKYKTETKRWVISM